jgi:hypothetical protein
MKIKSQGPFLFHHKYTGIIYLKNHKYNLSLGKYLFEFNLDYYL